MPINEMYGTNLWAHNGSATVDVNIPLSKGKPAKFVVAHASLGYAFGFGFDDWGLIGNVGVYSWDVVENGVIVTHGPGGAGYGIASAKDCTRVTFVIDSNNDTGIAGVGMVFVWR